MSVHRCAYAVLISGSRRLARKGEPACNASARAAAPLVACAPHRLLLVLGTMLHPMHCGSGFASVSVASCLLIFLPINHCLLCNLNVRMLPN
jgi:hypothetical protein